ncbi:MAG: glycosyl hydrolase family 20, partial [Turicibacter sp.]|nr:glycosyl hydrolase family 20 [Turicibacter sp.]
YSTFNPKLIREDYFKAKEIESALYTHLPNIKINNQIEIQEFLVAAEGISLINDFALHLLNNELNLSTSEPVNDAFELAQAFELWLQRYKNIWRLRNKESELNQIVNVIKYLCKYLRTH